MVLCLNLKNRLSNWNDYLNCKNESYDYDYDVDDDDGYDGDYDDDYDQYDMNDLYLILSQKFDLRLGNYSDQMLYHFDLKLIDLFF